MSELARATWSPASSSTPTAPPHSPPEVAARGRSPEKRRTYAAVFRSFAALLGPGATREDLIPAAVRAYRDALEQAGRSPTTVAKHLSALRGLATLDA